MKEFSINSEYPMNLIKEIVGDEWDGVELPRDILATVEYILFRDFTERDVDVIHYRFLYGMTYQEIGNIISLSRNRVGQLLQHSLRRLRHPSRKLYLQHGVSGIDKVETDEIIERYKKEHPVTDLVNNGIKQTVRDFNINELELSVRSYNALARANYETMSDIIYGFKTDQIYTVRNLGRKSLEEIHGKLVAIGVPESELEYDADYKAAEAAKDEKFDERVTEATMRVVYGEDNVNAVQTILKCLKPNEQIYAIAMKVGCGRKNVHHLLNSPVFKDAIDITDIYRIRNLWHGEIAKTNVQAEPEEPKRKEVDEMTLEEIYRSNIADIALSEGCEDYFISRGMNTVSRIIQALQTNSSSIPPWHVREVQEKLRAMGLSEVELHM